MFAIDFICEKLRSLPLIQLIFLLPLNHSIFCCVGCLFRSFPPVYHIGMRRVAPASAWHFPRRMQIGCEAHPMQFSTTGHLLLVRAFLRTNTSRPGRENKGRGDTQRSTGGRPSGEEPSRVGSRRNRLAGFAQGDGPPTFRSRPLVINRRLRARRRRWND